MDNKYKKQARKLRNVTLYEIKNLKLENKNSY